MCGIFAVRRMEVSCLAGRDQGTGRLPILRTQTWISNELVPALSCTVYGVVQALKSTTVTLAIIASSALPL